MLQMGSVTSVTGLPVNYFSIVFNARFTGTMVTIASFLSKMCLFFEQLPLLPGYRANSFMISMGEREGFLEALFFEQLYIVNIRTTTPNFWNAGNYCNGNR